MDVKSGMNFVTDNIPAPFKITSPFPEPVTSPLHSNSRPMTFLSPKLASKSRSRSYGSQASASMRSANSSKRMSKNQKIAAQQLEMISACEIA